MPREVQGVIDKMKENRCPTPEAIQVLLQQREAAVLALRDLLEETLRHHRPPAIQSDASMHAIFLLAALEAPEGLDPLLRILRRPQDFVEEFFGDILTECLSWAVARLARNHPEALLGLIRDCSPDHFVRDTVLKGFVAQAILWPDRRPRIVQELDKLLEEAAQGSDPLWNALLIGSVVSLASPELRGKVNVLFDHQEVDLTFISSDDVDRAYNRPASQHVETLDVFNLYRQYRWMLGWNDPEVTAEREAREQKEELADEGGMAEETAAIPPAFSSVKIGRNQPCPCAGGSKYKKCCLGVSNEEALRKILTGLGSATTIEQLKSDVARAIDAEELVRPSAIIEKALQARDGSELDFNSTEQARFFMSHFQAFWNNLADRRTPSILHGPALQGEEAKEGIKLP